MILELISIPSDSDLISMGKQVCPSSFRFVIK